MPGDDAILAIDQNRVSEAEFTDARGDLRHLRIAMGAGVLGIWDQPLNGDLLNLHHSAPLGC